jgi:KaiC/GvpD/RAD55 family RecA-like ATPase
MVEGKGQFHAVRFYYDAVGLCQIAADFVAEGLNAGQPAVIVATPSHTASIEAFLTARGFDIASVKRSGDLFVRDAAGVLASVMIDGAPSGARFERQVGSLIEAARGESGRKVRVYGEMVDVLWKAGSTNAAARLEAMWNSLASNHAFILLCAYALDGITHTTHISEICGHHTHVVSANGDVALAH